MLDLALAASLAVMGAASLPHCLVMCAAPCAAVTQGRAPGQWAFQLGRTAGYAAAGAGAVLVAGALQTLGGASAVMRPVWTALQAAVLLLGLFLLVQGRWPGFLGRWGRRAPSRKGAAVAGLAWVAWPCGLLQGALLVAALANTPWGGALGMAAFAVASSPALVAGPAVLRALGTRAPSDATAARLAGLLLAGAALWALGHGLWVRVAELCGL